MCVSAYVFLHLPTLVSPQPHAVGAGGCWTGGLCAQPQSVQLHPLQCRYKTTVPLPGSGGLLFVFLVYEGSRAVVVISRSTKNQKCIGNREFSTEGVVPGPCACVWVCKFSSSHCYGTCAQCRIYWGGFSLRSFYAAADIPAQSIVFLPQWCPGLCTLVSPPPRSRKRPGVL